MPPREEQVDALLGNEATVSAAGVYRHYPSVSKSTKFVREYQTDFAYTRYSHRRATFPFYRNQKVEFDLVVTSASGYNVLSVIKRKKLARIT
jgi:hypothetical protein